LKILNCQIIGLTATGSAGYKHYVNARMSSYVYDKI